MSLTIGTGITIGGGITFSPVYGVVTDGLVLALDAQSYSGTGTTWPATVGPDATLYNGVAWTGSGPGYFTFDPASLQFADTPNIGNLGSWTTECWFNLTAGWVSGGFPALVTTVYNDGAGTQYDNINYVLSPYPDNVSITNGYFNGGWSNTPGFAPTVGEWYQMVGTFDGTTLKLYVNGTEVSSVTGSGASIANGAPVRIARRWDGDNNSIYFMPAKIGVVNIYENALTAGQVAQNFNALKTRFDISAPLVTDGLIQNLDASNTDSYSGSGTDWFDLSGVGNNATLQGYAPWTDDGDQSYFVFSTGYADAGTILPNTAYTKIGIFRVTNNYGNLASGDGSNAHAFWGAGTQTLQSGHNGSWSTIVSNVTTPLDQWVFGAVTFDNTTGWKLYLNDNTPATNSSTDQFTANPALVYIGSYEGGTNLNGEVAVSLIYDRALSEAEMAQNFAHYQARFGL